MASVVQQTAAENQWVSAAMHTSAGYVMARLGQSDLAIAQYNKVLPGIEHGAAWNATYPTLICDAAAILWLLNRTDSIEIIERNLLQKVIAPDFRTPMRDGRLSMARLCALQGRYSEAGEWFSKARAVLDEQGARPLRAIADYDEALMYLRRAQTGDQLRAGPLLESARGRFRDLGMTGWINRAERTQPESA